MKIGLFFGSYNPVHVGHMIIANIVLQESELDRIWMVLSPQSPFKKKESLAKDYDRLHLLHLATENNGFIIPSSVEFGLTQPSYTVDTLTHLSEAYPDYRFSLIMGGDNLVTVPKWKNGEYILDNYQIIVYKRGNQETEKYKNHLNVSFVEAPLLHISATYVRNLIKAGKSVQYLVPDPVFHYLSGSNMYQ